MELKDRLAATWGVQGASVNPLHGVERWGNPIGPPYSGVSFNSESITWS